MTNIGYATLSVIPSLKGFQGAVTRGTGTAMSNAGSSAGRNFSGAFKKAAKLGALGGLGAAFGVGSFIKDSVELEARYSKTMAQMRVATRAPADELQRLDDLAIRLGKETVFSAVDASDAMLELAKNGIRPATIQAGALESALTLAAAGGTDLESSAQVMGNTLNAFRLKGGKAASVAAALAGAANASSASVGSLAEGLQQSSASAADAGLNVQETTGILAAFANAGISGSDAGTSLKTMLTRLVPSTAKAAAAMEKYGLKFTTTNGEFKSAVEIAENLKDGLGKLSAEERSAALNTIFGSDARRAATILTREGADGLAKYIKATSDQGAAEEMAQANMEGTAGAIERLKGAWETAKLEFGKSIAPVAADFLDYLADNIDEVAPKLVDFGNWFKDEGVPKIKAFSGFVKDDVLPVLGDMGEFAKDAAGFAEDLVSAFGKLPKPAQYAGLAALVGGGAAVKLRGGGGGALGTAGRIAGIARPVPVFVTNKGFGTGGGLPPVVPGKPGIPVPPVVSGGALRNLLLRLGLVGGGVAASGYGTSVRNPMDENGNPLKKGTDATAAAFLERRKQELHDFYLSGEKANKTAEKLGITTDANVGKFDAFYAATGRAKTRVDKMRNSVDLLAQVKIAPYVDKTSIERAIEAARTLNAALGANADVSRGSDGGVNYLHGGSGGGTNGRVQAGVVIDQRGSTIVAHDYDDFTGKLQKKAQRAGLGGRP